MPSSSEFLARLPARSERLQFGYCRVQATSRARGPQRIDAEQAPAMTRSEAKQVLDTKFTRHWSSWCHRHKRFWYDCLKHRSGPCDVGSKTARHYPVADDYAYGYGFNLCNDTP